MMDEEERTACMIEFQDAAASLLEDGFTVTDLTNMIEGLG